MSAEILIVDDEADIRNLIKGILEDEGYKTRLAATSKEAYAALEQAVPDLIVLDIWLQGSEHDGLQILEKVKAGYPYLPILMISGHGTIETAVSSIKQGAYDFIEKPFKSDRLLLMIRRALETAALRRENESLRKQARRSAQMVGNSDTFQDLQDLIIKVAGTNSRVLLTGEPGVGKDLAARAIHAASARADKPFVAVSCATLHPDRLESILFGDSALGVFEKADGGTLFLDEVADIPAETQGKIIRVIQDQRFQKKGVREEISVDLRIIASTSRDLEKMVKEGKFRQDLYYRLNVVPVAVPALKVRKGDIPVLVRHFIEEFVQYSGLSAKEFSENALAVMQGYDWPGNIRQLRNVVEWVLIMSGHESDNLIEATDLPPEIAGLKINSMGSVAGSPDAEIISLPLREAREVFERDYLLKQINRFEGNVSKTAQFIGMERSALHRKLKSLQIIGSDSGENEQREENTKQMRA